MNPFAFEPLDSPLARVSAVSKGLFLVCVSAAAMRFNLLPLAMLIGGGIVLMTVTRIPILGMGKAGAAIGWLALFSAMVRGILPGDGRLFAPETLPASALYAARLTAVFVFARLYYVSTKASELGDYLSAGARKVAGLFENKKGKFRILEDPGMLLSLSLLFLPRVFENYGKVKDAAELRGYGLRRNRLATTVPMIQTFIFTSIKGALHTARAMELRGYSEARTISLRRLSPVDVAVAAAGGILLVIASLGI